MTERTVDSEQRAPRVNYIGAPEFYNLNAACLLVTEAFHSLSLGTFHVGSSITRRDYRDVDVRVIMPDADFERMFAAKRGGWSNALWSLMCVSISAWLKERTGLPIDFQIQSMSEANGDYPGCHRNALGLFVPRHQRTTPEKCPTCDGYLGFGRVCPDCGSGTISEREGA
jgi:hypothetical protein